ncbi:N-acetyl-D-Glu racemase DgcA [Pseudaeromonas paramecii]|uniref:Dipeptide epimerase n=1 Tax=Pseudaeromonas paramecii TaxID=2138166 RepID=A0ABP8Q5H3_9GAMM
MQARVFEESWPIAGRFVISRGARTEARVVVVELTDGAAVGRGECVPYARYGETVEGVMAEIAELLPALEQGLSRQALQQRLPAGAARNAIDCALWDLECKQSGQRIWQRTGLSAPAPQVCAYTLSVDTPEAMEAVARQHAWRPLLKLKLAGAGDLARVAAVRRGAPEARIIVDANEGWDEVLYRELVPELATLGVAMIEQPLPAGQEALLATLPRPIPLCADESCHDRSSLPAVLGSYDLINIKTDKTGGLTEALALKAEAEAAGLGIMVGCMLATSLAMAPAFVLAQGVRVVDLDGPLLLATDRPDGFAYDGALMQPCEAALWG